MQSKYKIHLQRNNIFFTTTPFHKLRYLKHSTVFFFSFSFCPINYELHNITVTTKLTPTRFITVRKILYFLI